jgi:hypothetical protein
MADQAESLRTRWRRRLDRALRAGVRRWPLSRLERVDRDQWQALAAYRGLVHQAFSLRPLAPRVSSDYWGGGEFHGSAGRKPFFSPALRELENSSHHYGHDVQLKRHAGLPLIARQMPWVLEHGLKVSRGASFESPRPWMRGYLCMGPRRAGWLRERFGLPAEAIGPWIAYARPVLASADLRQLRQELGPTLLVVLAHSWDRVERRMDRGACIDAVAREAREGGYRSVIWLRHWKDPAIEGLPPEWIVACNGHRSNPWFLDCLRTLLELSDGLASNAFGTHLGYAVALERRLHWIAVAAEQDLSQLAGESAAEEAVEWSERQRLSGELEALLRNGGTAATAGVRDLLTPYWGFDAVRPPGELRSLLRPGRLGPASPRG